MSQIYGNTFDDQSNGEDPSGWTLDPANTSNIADDPAGGGGKCVEMTRPPSGQAYCRYNVSGGVAGGQVLTAFRMRRAEAPGSEDLVFEAFGEESQLLFGVGMKNGGQIRDANGNDFSQVQTWAEDTWYYFILEANLDTKKYNVWLDGDLVGSDIAFNQSAGSLLWMRFAMSATVNQRTGYFDNVFIYALDNQDSAPRMITFVTGFDLDEASASSHKDDSTPNEYSSAYSAENVLLDSIARSWRSDGAGSGTHDLRFDLGVGQAKTYRFVSLHGHNLTQSSTNLQSIRFLGSNDQNWSYPDVAIDLTNQYGQETITGWIPSAPACRYWCLRIQVGGSGLLGLSHIEIGRICAHTSYFTPSTGFDITYHWDTVDPSHIVRFAGGSRQFREKDPYRVAIIRWHAMPISDQESLETLYRSSGIHAPWVVLLDPSSRPSTRTLYAYLDDRELSFRRSHAERGRFSLNFEEIVS